MEQFYLCNSELFSLSNSTAVVYNFLCKVNNVSTGRSFYSRANIAAACHISESTVIRALRALCRKGLLEIRRRFDHGRQTSNDYILIDNPQIKMDSEQPPIRSAAPSDSSEKIDHVDRPRIFKCGLNIFQHHLTANDIKIYSYLTFRAGKDGRCMPSKKDIATDCSISVSTVWRSIRDLNEAGLVAIRRQTRLEAFGNNGSSVNLYILKSPQEASEAYSELIRQFHVKSSKYLAADTLLPTAENRSNSEKVILPDISAKKHLFPYMFLKASFFHINDTLPHFTDDTPRTMSRKKATVNPRDKGLFSKLTEWYNRAARKLAGYRIPPAKPE